MNWKKLVLDLIGRHENVFDGLKLDDSLWVGQLTDTDIAIFGACSFNTFNSGRNITQMFVVRIIKQQRGLHASLSFVGVTHFYDKDVLKNLR